MRNGLQDAGLEPRESTASTRMAQYPPLDRINCRGQTRRHARQRRNQFHQIMTGHLLVASGKGAFDRDSLDAVPSGVDVPCALM